MTKQQGWLTVYYRDSEGVMRAIDGIKLLPGAVLRLDKSVYTRIRDDAGHYWIEIK